MNATERPTKKWKFIVDPCKLNQKMVQISRSGERFSSEIYTLDSFESTIQNSEISQRIRQKWNEALEKNPGLKPGLKFRLFKDPSIEKREDSMNGYTIKREEQLGKFEYLDKITRIKLQMGITDYGVFVATNSAAKYDSEHARFLMEKGRIFFGDENLLFASPVGNCAIVESSDNKIALIKRAMDLYEY